MLLPPHGMLLQSQQSHNMKRFLLLILATVALFGSFLAGRSYERRHFALDAQSWTDGVFWGWCAGRNDVNWGAAVKTAYFQKTVASKDQNAGPLRESHRKVMEGSSAVESLNLSGDTE